jgi:hypothetical protein
MHREIAVLTHVDRKHSIRNALSTIKENLERRHSFVIASRKESRSAIIGFNRMEDRRIRAAVPFEAADTEGVGEARRVRCCATRRAGRE